MKTEDLLKKQHIINVALGREKADMVLKNAAYVNVFTNDIRTADIAVSNGIIAGIGRYSSNNEIDMSGKIILPGFIDAHIHLESSLLLPGEFAKAVLPHGTTTVVADPHEIANVMGRDGIEYMMQSSKNLPVDMYFMLPSCVPATPFDESGAALNHVDIESFYSDSRVRGLAEVMNYEGVLSCDKEVLKKIMSALSCYKKVDGHAPDLPINKLNAYIASGIYSDHECHDVSDAMLKLERGQMIMIREGTAAKNLEELADLMRRGYADRCMFCTDDLHVNDIIKQGHIDHIIKKAIALGVEPVDAVKSATYIPANYFLLHDRGAIAPGYLADFVVIDSFENFHVEQVFKNGKLMYDAKELKDFDIPVVDSNLEKLTRHTFHVRKLVPDDFKVKKSCGIIGMINGEITTLDKGRTDRINVADDVLKISLVERHGHTNHIGIGFLKGYGLKSGSIASSISHDSHNIIVVGTNEKDMASAVNRIAELNGGIVVFNNGKSVAELPLSVAGIMSTGAADTVSNDLENAKQKAFSLGVIHTIDPFMTLSFMALPVIPALRITTNGVFDVAKQKYI